MKNIFYSLLFSFAIGAFAQNTKIIKGDKLNQKLAYIDAIKTYENIVKKGFVDHKICEKIGPDVPKCRPPCTVPKSPVRHTA